MEEGDVLRLKWSRYTAGYEIRTSAEQPRRLPPFHRYGGDYFVPRGKRIEIYEIGLREDNVWVELANASGRDAALRFVNNWGLLLDPSKPEYLERFLKAAREMAKTLPSSSSAFFRERRYAPLDLEVAGRRMILRPKNLEQHCWLQRLHAHQGNVAIAQCPSCRNYLGTHRGPGPGKKTCSDRCRQAAYRQRKKRALN
jgi:hypothetical protein